MTLEFLLQDLPVFLLPIRPSVRRPLVPNGTFTTRRFAYRDVPGNRTGKYTIRVRYQNVDATRKRRICRDMVRARGQASMRDERVRGGHEARREGAQSEATSESPSRRGETGGRARGM